MVEKVLGYLEDFPDSRIKFDHQDLKGFPMLQPPDLSFKNQYADAFKEFDE